MSSAASPTVVQPTTATVETTVAGQPTTVVTTTTPTSVAAPTTSTAASPRTSTNVAESSPTSSIPESTSSTSTSISVVVVTSVETVSGSTRTITSSSSSTSLIPTQANSNSNNGGGGGGGLSLAARNGIIGAASGVGGLLLLVGLFFFFTRCIRKRRSAYEPGEDEIRWPEAEPDSGALFTPAVRRTGGAGLGRETSMRSTTSGFGSIPTAGYASSDGHNNAGWGTFAAGGAAAGAGAAGAGYYSSKQHDQPPEALANPYDDDDGYAPRDYQDHQYEESIRGGRGQLRPTNYSNLDRIYDR